MGHADDPQEWLRLNQLYQAMGDIELLQLRDAFKDLTPVAQNVLQPVLQTRGLWRSGEALDHATPEAKFAETTNLQPSSYSQQEETIDRDALLMDTGVAVRAYDSFEEAGLMRDYLQKNKIESLFITTKRGYPVRFPEIMVFPKDVERANEIIDRADLEILRHKAEANSGPIIENSSNCPACGSAEILLQPSTPSSLNVWLCGNCNHSWQDNLPENWPAGS